jgi:hypothetical protein
MPPLSIHDLFEQQACEAATDLRTFRNTHSSLLERDDGLLAYEPHTSSPSLAPSRPMPLLPSRVPLPLIERFSEHQ